MTLRRPTDTLPIPALSPCVRPRRWRWSLESSSAYLRLRWVETPSSVMARSAGVVDGGVGPDPGKARVRDQGVQRSGKSLGNSISYKVRELSGNFVMGQEKLKMWKVREFWTGHGYGGFMSNFKHFGQHPHSLLMELLASVTWMSSSYDSLDISLMSDKLI